ncbi:ORFL278C.iORF1 [Human betaherpesvirus 5]|nr:ORFL278C.iORF1 [Human betaherpesvirus 5]
MLASTWPTWSTTVNAHSSFLHRR